MLSKLGTHQAVSTSSLLLVHRVELSFFSGHIIALITLHVNPFSNGAHLESTHLPRLVGF
jgi:hypothetical protein